MDSKDSLVLRRLIWRRILDDRSIESCTIAGRQEGFGIAGHVIAAHDERPLDVVYDIQCRLDWTAQRVAIKQIFDGADRRLEMVRTNDGWLIDSLRDARLDECLEPDLTGRLRGFRESFGCLNGVVSSLSCALSSARVLARHPPSNFG